jgi:DNA-binding MarR family transcriptional regulator
MNDFQKQNSHQEVQTIQTLLLIGRKVMMELDVALENAGLSAAKLWALKPLIEADDCLGVTQLADCIGSGKSNATQILDRMEVEGLVRRVPNPDDRRSVLVEVTEEGLARYKIGIDLHRQTAERMLHQLDASQRAQFAAFLETIRDSL